ncbi:hypothetical protein BDD12DRAFT_725839 [Trichophaea hybrida]|nr:hypothetical protein BDD12DRAFT_725839 [Trichophaea hybrida]
MGLVHDIVEQEAKCTYRNLCSEEDAPRSVAICPQRRCVAFGCQGGIELHWVDALTGQDLNRWFPLTAPTDFLYFLPPRRGIDSAKKLRLISSAAHPEEMNPLIKRFGINRGSIAYWGTTREPRLGQSDHFQAVPLSDGYNVLFTDPASASLYIGSDAPLGCVFLQASYHFLLLRKIRLIPPECLDQGREDSEDEDFNVWMKSTEAQLVQTRPNVYASGTDLRYGLRVVAGYNERVIFFSIPPDLFNGFINNKERDEGTNASGEPNSTSENSIEIQGCYVDTVQGLVDLAVHSGSEMTVYAFSSSGVVKAYQLDGTNLGCDFLVIKKSFGENGQVLDQKIDGECGESECAQDTEGSLDGDDFDWHASGFPTWDRNLSEIEEERQAWESVASLGESWAALECEIVL